MKILGSYELFICHLFDEKGVLNCGNLEKGFVLRRCLCLRPASITPNLMLAGVLLMCPIFYFPFISEVFQNAFQAPLSIFMFYVVMILK